MQGIWTFSVTPEPGLSRSWHQVPVVSLDDLIRMKQAAGRPKDLKHLTELESLRRLLAD